MLFSCKITHSLISCLDRRGEDLEVLYEKCDWPAEFLRDPSSWLEADKMESLLRMIDLEYGRRLAASAEAEEGFIASVGHQSKDLRAWGVLDSVLRMVQTPKDLFAQPERFLSYFVSPAPPVGEVRRGSDSVSFVLPVSEVQFPFVTSYLRAALEALPTYINKPMASVSWDNSRVTISWSESQASLFGESQNTELSLHPELVRSILINLESSQKQLEEMKREIIAKDQEIATLKENALTANSLAQPHSNSNNEPRVAEISSKSSSSSSDESIALAPVVQGLTREFQGPLKQVLTDLYRLGDYMARGQQLITLLVGQGRQSPQVLEAMRRVDWPFVSAEGPAVVKKAVAGLQEIQEALRDLHLVAGISGAQDTLSMEFETDRVPTDLNELVGRAISTVQAREASQSSRTGAGSQIDRHLMLDRPVSINPGRLEQAVVNLLANALDSFPSGERATIRVVTRPRGSRAEIEITDTGCGMSQDLLKRAQQPFFTTKPAPAAGLGLPLAQSIVRMHDGLIAISSEPGRGSTIVVDLPLV